MIERTKSKPTEERDGPRSPRSRTIAAFSARLRDDVDLDMLSTELLAVVDQTMQPARPRYGSGHRPKWHRAVKGKDTSAALT